MKVKLKNLGKIITGNTPKKSDEQNYTSNDICFVKPSDISDDVITKITNTEHYISNYATNTARLAPKDSVLVTCIGIIGKIAILEKNSAFNQQINAIIPYKDKVLSNYLAYNLFYRKNYMQQKANAPVVPIINKTQFEDLEITFHSLEEQKKIANTLDKVTNLIMLRKKQLEKLDIFSKALFVEMFGSLEHNINYPYKKIVEFSNVISGGTPNRKKEDYWLNGTINWVKTTELKNTKINNSEEKISELGLENSSAKIVPKNTILIAMYGQGKTRGMTALLNIEASTNQACACILPSKNINYMYLWQYMILSYNQLRSMAKGGNQPNLNLDIIKNFKVLTPPIELQNQFAKKVEHIDKIKLSIQDSLTKLETLKKSLMQEYFS